MNSFTCISCKHFRQHYIKFGARFSKCGSGHCVFPRRKPRQTDFPACEHFAARALVPVKRIPTQKNTPER